MSTYTDEDLMIMVKAGNTSAYNALYEKHQGKVLGYISKKITDTETALDIFQRVWRKFLLEHLYTKTQKSFFLGFLQSLKIKSMMNLEKFTEPMPL